MRSWSGDLLMMDMVFYFIPDDDPDDEEIANSARKVEEKKGFSDSSQSHIAANLNGSSWEAALCK